MIFELLIFLPHFLSIGAIAVSHWGPLLSSTGMNLELSATCNSFCQHIQEFQYLSVSKSGNEILMRKKGTIHAIQILLSTGQCNDDLRVKALIPGTCKEPGGTQICFHTCFWF